MNADDVKVTRRDDGSFEIEFPEGVEVIGVCSDGHSVLLCEQEEGAAMSE